MWRFLSEYFSDKAGEIAKKQLEGAESEIRSKVIPPDVLVRKEGNKLFYEFVSATSVVKAEVEFPEEIILMPVPDWVQEISGTVCEKKKTRSHKGLYCLKSEAAEYAKEYMQKLKAEGIDF